MQLTGPPRINGWEAPYPTKQTPLDAAFQRDTDVETYNKYRDGRVRRVGPRHYRLQLRFLWDGISYDMAHAILSEISTHPVPITPRTKRSSDPSYLTEHTYDCRLTSELPASTPIYRSGGGERIARVEVEVQSIGTITELPDATAGGVEEVN